MSNVVPKTRLTRAHHGRENPSGPSARDAIQAAEWSLWIEPLNDDGPADRELRLGFDTIARLLETVVLVFDDGGEMVMPAIPARKKYLDLLP